MLSEDARSRGWFFGGVRLIAYGKSLQSLCRYNCALRFEKYALMRGRLTMAKDRRAHSNDARYEAASVLRGVALLALPLFSLQRSVLELVKWH